MSVAAQARPRASARRRFRPRPRQTELSLLALVAVALVVGGASLGATQQYREALSAGETLAALDFSPPDPRGLLAYLGALFVVHLLFVLAGRRIDQVLFPAVAMLGGIGLLLMQRLPQAFVTQSFFGTELFLGQLQLAWLLIALDGGHGTRARRALGRVAADLQVHVGRGGHRAAARDVRVRLGRRTAPG